MNKSSIIFWVIMLTFFGMTLKMIFGKKEYTIEVKGITKAYLEFKDYFNIGTLVNSVEAYSEKAAEYFAKNPDLVRITFTDRKFLSACSFTFNHMQPTETWGKYNQCDHNCREYWEKHMAQQGFCECKEKMRKEEIKSYKSFAGHCTTCGLFLKEELEYVKA